MEGRKPYGTGTIRGRALETRRSAVSSSAGGVGVVAHTVEGELVLAAGDREVHEDQGAVADVPGVVWAGGADRRVLFDEQRRRVVVRVELAGSDHDPQAGDRTEELGTQRLGAGHGQE
ncbi:hypothetical protein [Streptomyces sp. NPDC055105]|jgi:hypothetical protein|uniref:hypothetical protein n=1 Tax=Streptomyces sp. NPDC055105 TaxID=3365719 RepID=UPI0037D338C9